MQLREVRLKKWELSHFDGTDILPQFRACNDSEISIRCSFEPCSSDFVNLLVNMTLAVCSVSLSPSVAMVILSPYTQTRKMGISNKDAAE